MKIKNQSGFSLIQVMIAIGLMGGVSVAMMQQQKTASSMQSKMNTNSDINTVTNNIQTIMSISKNCIPTIQLIQNPAVLQKEILRVRRDPATGLDLPPEKVYDLGSSIGNNLYIEKMELATTQSGQDALRVYFKRMKKGDGSQLIEIKGELGGGRIAKDFLLLGEKDGLGNFLNCYSADQAVIDEMLKKMPKCIYTPDACVSGSAYDELQQTLKQEFIIAERRSCVGNYTASYCGSGNVSPKTCYCSTPNCSCTTKWVNCFNRQMQPCQKDNWTEVKTIYKCCQDPVVTAPSPQPTCTTPMFIDAQGDCVNPPLCDPLDPLTLGCIN